MRWTLGLLAVFTVTVSLVMPDDALSAQVVRHVLTSVEQNVDVGDWQIGARETSVAPDVP